MFLLLEESNAPDEGQTYLGMYASKDAAMAMLRTLHHTSERIIEKETEYPARFDESALPAKRAWLITTESGYDLTLLEF